MTFKNVYFQGSPRERASAGGGGVVRQRKAPSGKTLQKELVISLTTLFNFMFIGVKIG